MHLLEGESVLPTGRVMTSREWAAERVQKVAELGEVGMYPSDLEVFDLGRALARLLVNSELYGTHGIAGIVADIAKGMVHTESNRIVVTKRDERYSL